ncbi:non-ribosomal peptide synthetase [Pseudophaeobacter arcticus]|uniref:non-ribosomal peptide synthetase n=1 Tax=Pseudophaeobacter arcticus TaxID=385492 RepID=UPI00248FAB70|nr:amino acid adenylation domain-containing protein [Pseudophaeobacter arcticus]
MTPKPPAVTLSKDALKAHLKSLLRSRMGTSGDWYPLSQGQQSLWFLWKMAPESAAFSMVFPMQIRGALDRGALDRAFAALVARHACLRCAFVEEDGIVRQGNHPNQSPRIQHRDAEGWSQEALQQDLEATARRPFDLRGDASLRAHLWRCGAESHVFCLVMHHITGDLWSLVVLMDELQQLYAAQCQVQPQCSGRDANVAVPAVLPNLPVTYGDYVQAMQLAQEGGKHQAALDYWAQELAGDLPALDLPTDFARPARQQFDGATHFQTLDTEITSGIEALARAQDTTVFVVLLAAYQTLLHRFSGQSQLMVGTPFSGRTLPGTAGIIGDFINMLPLKAVFDESTTFAGHVAALRDRLLQAMKHQEVPFSQIVDRLAPLRDLSRPPVFQTTFVLQKFHRYGTLQNAFLPGEGESPVPFADLELSGIPMAQQDGQFDLNLEMKRDSLGRMQAAWKYDKALFSGATIANIAACFRVLLQGLIQQPTEPVARLPLLQAIEADAVIAAAKGPVVAPPEQKSLAELFEYWAHKTPQAPAISCPDQQLSYIALQDRMQHLARALAARGVSRETMVALVLPRGCDLAAAMLGTQRAGGAFLPLAPDTPPKRLQQVIGLSDSRLVLTSAATEAALRLALGATGPEVVSIEALLSQAQDHALPDLPSLPGDTDLAYMMFTSGSTGTPKGVMVEHLGMVNHSLGKLEDLGFSAADCLAQNAPASFDVVVWQNLAPLACGGSVRVIDDRDIEDPARLFAACRASGVTVLQVVPSMMRALIEEAEAAGQPPDLGALRWLVPTGEALPTELCHRWLALYPDIPILNTYGSTECSDDQCHYRLVKMLPEDDIAPIITVGTPIRNMAAYVLDPALHPVPPGVTGELYIGGIGVGRGYRGDAAKTEAAFLPDPFSDRPGARLYRSRDMARRRADGRIDFLGRLDTMVKLQGVRIEPAEIEAALVADPQISSALVQPRPDPEGQLRLVGYIVAAGGQTPDHIQVRANLSQRLPYSMIPDVLVALPEIPLTANGKRDVKALPDPPWPDLTRVELVPPKTKTEQQIADIWAGLLGRDTVSVQEDFFAAGGDSIKSIKLAARAQDLGLPLEAADVFINRTIAAIAQQVDLAALSRADKDQLKSIAKATAKENIQELFDPALLSRAARLVTFDQDDS